MSATEPEPISEDDDKPLGIGAVATACRDFLAVYDTCATTDDLRGAFTELYRVLAPTREAQAER